MFCSEHGQTLHLTLDGKLAPLTIQIHGTTIFVFSIHCALAAFITLKTPEAASRLGGSFEFALRTLLLLGKWSHSINPNGDHPTPDTFSVTCADVGEPRKPGLQTEYLLVCGTSKATTIPRKHGDPNMRHWTEHRQRTLQEAIGVHPQAKLAEQPETDTSAKRDKFSFLRAPRIEDIRKIKNQISCAFSHDPVLVRLLNAILDKFEQTPNLGIAPRHTFGSCAETWGMQIFAKTLTDGAVGTSFSIAGTQLDDLEIALLGHDWESKIELKPACNNCVYLYGAIAINCGITIRDGSRLRA